MRDIVESLKRLYDAGKITKEQVLARYTKGIITLEEYNYIVSANEE